MQMQVELNLAKQSAQNIEHRNSEKQKLDESVEVNYKVKIE